MKKVNLFCNKINHLSLFYVLITRIQKTTALMMHKLNIALLFILVSFVGFSQRGKDGDYTAAAFNELVNTYTELTADANVGATLITVSKNTMTESNFLCVMCAGE